MSAKAFIEEIKKGLKSPVYLLYSQENYLLRQALHLLRDSVPEAERDFTFHVFDAEQTPVEDVVDVLNTVSLMGGRKIVVMDGSQRLKDKDFNPVVRYAERPSPDSVLVLLNDGELKKSHKDTLSKIAKLVFLGVKAEDMPGWVRDKAAHRGLKLTGAAIDCLLGMTGGDMGVLSSEIDKLSTMGKKEIDEADVMECVRASGDFSPFDLADALGKKDAVRVFGIYKALSGSMEPQALLGALNWHYGRKTDKLRKRAVALLNEADIMIKTGRSYPLEYLFVRLLKLKP